MSQLKDLFCKFTTAFACAVALPRPFCNELFHFLGVSAPSCLLRATLPDLHVQSRPSSPKSHFNCAVSFSITLLKHTLFADLSTSFFLSDYHVNSVAAGATLLPEPSRLRLAG